MTYPLPNLNALRAFEAAARHLSFKEAALELNVTPGAIGQQVKNLEQELGVGLFRRMTRQIVLTEAGQALLPKVRQGFQLISAASEALKPDRNIGTLTVSTFPSFAAKWLVPRLGRFTEHHPELDVRISAQTRLVDFLRDGVDVAVRQGEGRYPGLRSDFLLHAELFPVCSPALLEGEHPLRKPEDLRHHHLLHNQRGREWALWLKAFDVQGVNPARGTQFSDDSLALEAAIEGQGIAITREPIASADLASGVLVRPFPQSTPDLFGIYLVYPEERASVPKIAAFRDWFITEMHNDPSWHP